MEYNRLYLDSMHQLQSPTIMKNFLHANEALHIPNVNIPMKQPNAIMSYPYDLKTKTYLILHLVSIPVRLVLGNMLPVDLQSYFVERA